LTWDSEARCNLSIGIAFCLENRGPGYVFKKEKTPVLAAEETRLLLDAIDTSTTLARTGPPWLLKPARAQARAALDATAGARVAGLHDRAIIGVMVCSFARVSAIVGMRVKDYCQQGKRWWFRLQG